jgi:hypothetical protein
MNVIGKGAATSGLTDQIRHSVNNPLTFTDFDFTAVLDDVLSTWASRSGTLVGTCASTAEPTR